MDDQETKARKAAMQERLEHLEKERKEAELIRLLKPKRRQALMQKIKKGIRGKLKKREWKFFKKLWDRKEKSIYELTGHADSNIRSKISRLNKKIKDYGRIKGCRDIDKPKHYRFVCPLLAKKE